MAPVTVRLIKLVTSQIFDYFHGRNYMVAVNIQFYITEPVIPVALVNSHCFYTGLLWSWSMAIWHFNVITKTGYDHPFIFHSLSLIALHILCKVFNL